MAALTSKLGMVGGKVGGTLRTVIKRYGPEIALSLVSGFLSNLVTDRMSGKGKRGKKRKKR